MDQNMQGSADTGTKDDTYDIIAVLYHALQGAENCELYADDAQGDQELSQFFERAGDSQRQLAEQAKQLLSQRLLRETQGGGSSSGSAFNQFGSSSAGAGMAGGASAGMSGSQDMGSTQDRQGGGSAYSAGVTPNASTDDQSTQFGQSALGQGQRHNEMTTGGGGTSTF